MIKKLEASITKLKKKAVIELKNGRSIFQTYRNNSIPYKITF